MTDMTKQHILTGKLRTALRDRDGKPVVRNNRVALVPVLLARKIKNGTIDFDVNAIDGNGENPEIVYKQKERLTHNETSYAKQDGDIVRVPIENSQLPFDESWLKWDGLFNMVSRIDDNNEYAALEMAGNVRIVDFDTVVVFEPQMSGGFSIIDGNFAHTSMDIDTHKEAVSYEYNRNKAQIPVIYHRVRTGMRGQDSNDPLRSMQETMKLIIKQRGVNLVNKTPFGGGLISSEGTATKTAAEIGVGGTWAANAENIKETFVGAMNFLRIDNESSAPYTAFVAKDLYGLMFNDVSGTNPTQTAWERVESLPSYGEVVLSKNLPAGTFWAGTSDATKLHWDTIGDIVTLEYPEKFNLGNDVLVMTTGGLVNFVGFDGFYNAVYVSSGLA